MTPYAQAECLAASQGHDLDFAVCAHMISGYVVTTPEFFFLARVIHHDWPDSRRCDPTDADPAGDTLFIWCLAGDLQKAESYFPLLPVKKWVAFARRNSPRFWSYDRFRSSIARDVRRCL